MVKSLGTWGRIPTLICVSLNKLLNFSGLQFPHVLNGDNNGISLIVLS